MAQSPSGAATDFYGWYGWIWLLQGFAKKCSNIIVFSSLDTDRKAFFG